MRNAHFGSLGFYSLGIHYGVWGLVSVFSTPIVHYFGDKCCMIFGGFMYSMYIGVFLLPIEREEHPENQTL
jgi:hypothetical protein